MQSMKEKCFMLKNGSLSWSFPIFSLAHALRSLKTALEIVYPPTWRWIKLNKQFYIAY